MILTSDQRMAAALGLDVDNPFGRASVRNKKWSGGVMVYDIDSSLCKLDYVLFSCNIRPPPSITPSTHLQHRNYRNGYEFCISTLSFFFLNYKGNNKAETCTLKVQYCVLDHTIQGFSLFLEKI